jgi:hypothetical protein
MPILVLQEEDAGIFPKKPRDGEQPATVSEWPADLGRQGLQPTGVVWMWMGDTTSQTQIHEILGIALR